MDRAAVAMCCARIVSGETLVWKEGFLPTSARRSFAIRSGIKNLQLPGCSRRNAAGSSKIPRRGGIYAGINIGTININIRIVPIPRRHKRRDQQQIHKEKRKSGMHERKKNVAHVVVLQYAMLPSANPIVIQ